jgi:hypothetical protein
MTVRRRPEDELDNRKTTTILNYRSPVVRNAIAMRERKSRIQAKNMQTQNQKMNSLASTSGN